MTALLTSLNLFPRPHAHAPCGLASATRSGRHQPYTPPVDIARANIARADPIVAQISLRVVFLLVQRTAFPSSCGKRAVSPIAIHTKKRIQLVIGSPAISSRQVKIVSIGASGPPEHETLFAGLARA